MESYQIENLTFKYPGAKNAALNNITLKIGLGEFVTVCGKSGCGKSTFLRKLKPIISPCGETSGNIYFENSDITNLTSEEQSKKIGFVWQNPDNQIVCDKVWHEIAFGLENLGINQNEIRERVCEIASFFGIESWFSSPVSELSGGQKQILNLASVMVMRPSVLILDEPTSQLDPIAASDFLQALFKINRELSTTVIISEHRLEDTFSMSDKIIVMDSGEVLAFDTPSKIGIKLKNQNHDMLCALPCATRCSAELDKNLTNLPVTVREGKKWLTDFLKTHPFNHELIKKRSVNSFNETAIELKNLKFKYEKNSKDIINNLCAKINRGEIYAILGGNGTGKTTALSLMCAQNIPYCGKVLINGTDINEYENPMQCGICMLSQNPQTMFLKKTVKLDLYDTLPKSMSKEEKEENFNKVVDLCSLNGLTDMHPYDLSGGEMQRAALAKILLLKPKIILLDEATKGLDAHFKIKLSEILLSLKNEGVTIVMVSHDIEFCAKYADRCALFFNGSIVSESTPETFFKNKTFYTTAAYRMSSDIIDDVIVTEDILCGFGKTIIVNKEENFTPPSNLSDDTPKSKQKISLKNIVFGLSLFIVCAILNIVFFNKISAVSQTALTVFSIFLTAAGINFLIPQKALDFSENAVRLTQKKEKFSLRPYIFIFLSVIIMAFTVFVGVRFLNNKKYYFISLLIIIEAFISFAFTFEKRKPRAREIVIISVFCAIAVAGRTAFFMLQQFKPMLAIVIIAGICFGAEAGFLTGAVSGFVSNFFFSQGPWTPWQMFALGISGCIAGIIFKFIPKTRGSICIYGFFSALVLYGSCVNLSAALQLSQNITLDLVIYSFALGFPFDIIHAAATVFFLWFTCAPMIEKTDRIKIKYNLLNN